MIYLELSEQEQQALIGLLEESISELRREIVHTEKMEFKENLKQRKATLTQILEMLKGVEAGSAAV